MQACVALLRLVCALVGASLAVLYVSGYANGRAVLTPRTTDAPPNAHARATAEATTSADPAAPGTPTAAQVPPAVQQETQSSEEDEPACRWWTPETGRATDTLCSAFALRRLMGSDALARALVRAQQCAALHGTDCVLSHEVGLQVPAVMLWSTTASAMRMYLLPRTVPHPTGAGTDERRVAIARPPFDDDLARSRTPLVVAMNRSVEVDHVGTVSHVRESELLLDDDAYCMQMLQFTIPERCNEEL